MAKSSTNRSELCTVQAKTALSTILIARPDNWLCSLALTWMASLCRRFVIWPWSLKLWAFRATFFSSIWSSPHNPPALFHSQSNYPGQELFFNWDCNLNKNNIYTHFVFNYTAIYAFHHWEHSSWRGQLLNVKIIHRAGVKYVLSNTNTKISIFQIHIQIFCSTLIQIQIHRYKYKYIQPNISAETVQIQNWAILWIPRYMLMACVSLCLSDTWS